jgi:hypothetical protein
MPKPDPSPMNVFGDTEGVPQSVLWKLLVQCAKSLVDYRRSKGPIRPPLARLLASIPAGEFIVERSNLMQLRLCLRILYLRGSESDPSRLARQIWANDGL